MEEQGFWNPMQFAYRKGLSTVTTMLMLHEYWMVSIDKEEQNVCISIDLSSAFDKVNHKVLIKKQLTLD